MYLNLKPAFRVSLVHRKGLSGVWLEASNLYKDKKVIVVMPAYNAAQTLRRTYDEVMEQGIVDLVIVVDDDSSDETVSISVYIDNPGEP